MPYCTNFLSEKKTRRYLVCCYTEKMIRLYCSDYDFCDVAFYYAVLSHHSPQNFSHVVLSPERERGRGDRLDGEKMKRFPSKYHTSPLLQVQHTPLYNWMPSQHLHTFRPSLCLSMGSQYQRTNKRLVQNLLISIHMKYMTLSVITALANRFRHHVFLYVFFTN